MKPGLFKTDPVSTRILLIASKLGYQTRTFAEAAERSGYSVRMATDRCQNLDDPWGDSAIPLHFEQPERAAGMIASQGERYAGILAAGDRPALIAAHTAARLGLPFSPPEAVAACRNKFESRERLRSAGLPVPEFRRIPIDEAPLEAARYPCVLKPLGLSASRGVIRANDGIEYRAAFRRIRAILADPDVRRMREDHDRFVIEEDFIPGREFALEGLLTRGSFETLAIFDKPDPLDGPYFEETIYVTPSRASAEVQAAIISTTGRAVQALGLTHGPVHAEMRVNDRGVWMLEVAARPIGGLCSRALRFEGGSSLEDVLCRHAAGDPIGSLRLADGGRGVMMIPIPAAGVYNGVRGTADAAAVEGIEEVVITAKEGQELLPLPEGSSYLGFIFARGASPAAAETALRESHARLKFDIGTQLNVL